MKKLIDFAMWVLGVISVAFLVAMIVYSTSCKAAIVDAGTTNDIVVSPDTEVEPELTDSSKIALDNIAGDVKILKEQLSVVITNNVSMQNQIKNVQNSSWLMFGVFGLNHMAFIILWILDTIRENKRKV